MKFLLTILLIFALAGCSSGGASHIPPPWQLPGSAIGSILENTAYKPRRRKVERFTADNYEAIALDIHSGGGATLTQVLAIAHVPLVRHEDLISSLNDNTKIYFNGSRTQNIERLVVAFMVYGG